MNERVGPGTNHVETELQYLQKQYVALDLEFAKYRKEAEEGTKSLMHAINLLSAENGRLCQHKDELLHANNVYRYRAIKAEDALKVK